jgi:thiamine-phosphate pyrophosphorylase
VTLPRLYAVLDTAVAEQHGWAPLDLGQAFLDGGARLIQLRAKAVHARWLLSLADALVAAGAAVGASILINDRADVALLAEAAGVHLGQDDLAPADARRVLGAMPLVGWSTHTPAQVSASVALPVSYVAVGPVFQTRTKETGYAPVGTAFVREAVRLAGGRPVVAIGGITLDAAPAVIDAGASAVAVIGDLLSGGDPAARVAAYVARLGGSGPPKTGRV